MSKEEEKAPTLDEMLRLQERIDSGTIVVSKDDFAITEEALRNKLDAYVGMMRAWEGSSIAFKEEAKRLADKSKAAKKAIENLKSRYKFLATYYEQYELFGSTYKFSFSPTESVEVDIADKDLTIQDKTAYYDFIDEKTVYTWNKKALKEAMKNGSELGVARIKKDLKLSINPIPVNKKKGK